MHLCMYEKSTSVWFMSMCYSPYTKLGINFYKTTYIFMENLGRRGGRLPHRTRFSHHPWLPTTNDCLLCSYEQVKHQSVNIEREKTRENWGSWELLVVIYSLIHYQHLADKSSRQKKVLHEFVGEKLSKLWMNE